MAFCEASFAHAYDAEKSVLANIFDVREYVEVLSPQFPHICYSGFIPSTDISTLFLIVGVVVGQHYWSKRPRIAGAVMAGSLVFWAGYQFVMFRFRTLLITFTSQLEHEEMEVIQRAYSSAFWQQALFEIAIFLALPLATAYYLRNRRPRLQGNDEILARLGQ